MMWCAYKRILLFSTMVFSGGLYSMQSMMMPKLESLPEAWSVSVQNDTWYITAPQSNTAMVFSMDQISSIISSMNADQRSLVLYGNTVDGMTQLIKYITDHSITSANISSLSSSFLSSSSSSSSSMPDFMRVRDRMRALAGTMSHGMAIPKVTIHQKILEYKAAQMRGDISRLEFEKRQIQTDIRDVPWLFRETIWSWTGWVQQMEQRIRIIDTLLAQEITAELNTIRTGKLGDAEAVVAKIAARWPYSVGIISTVQEHQKIQEYINKVGFNELRAAKNLIALRPDYQKKIADQKAELARQQEVAKQQALEQEHQKELEIQRQKEAAAAMQTVLPKGMQHEIIDVLGSNRTQEAVAQQLDTKVQEVIRQAELHNVLIHPELDWRLQAALKSLPKSVDAQDFTFKLATIEHLVNDIHMQASPNQKSLIERSPELLARAVNKYFEYLAPTETELALVVDAARYVSDMTTGSEYLSAEVRKQRIDQFWKAVDNLSLSNLSGVTAKQVVDSVAYVAARATYMLGARMAMPVIKNLKHIAAAAPRAATVFADRIIKAFDSIIHASPALITADGTVIWNATPEAAAEARQLVHAFDGMKDKPSGKPPVDILDDTKKVVENESKLETKTVGDLIKEAKSGEIKRYARIYEKTGRYEEAMRDFECLGPSDVKSMPDGKVGKVGKLADGRVVIVREYSKGKMGEPSGPPTLEIQADSSKIIKFRYRG